MRAKKAEHAKKTAAEASSAGDSGTSPRAGKRATRPTPASTSTKRDSHSEQAKALPHKEITTTTEKVPSADAVTASDSGAHAAGGPASQTASDDTAPQSAVGVTVAATSGAKVTSAVAAVAHDVLAPLSDPSAPGTPPVTAVGMWAMAAAARRESAETEVKPAAAQSTSTSQAELTVQPAATQTTDATEPVTIVPGVVVDPSLTGHYVVTAKPSFTDQLINFGLAILNKISTLIGVNLAFKLNGLMATSDPPFFITLGLNASKTTYTFTDSEGQERSWKVWAISPKTPTDKVTVVVHGGAFILQPSLLQWSDYASMARDTGATVIVPIFTLSQKDGGQAAVIVPAMTDFIADEVRLHGSDNVGVYADSSGGDIAVLALQKLARDCAGDATCLAQNRPGHMVLISPAVPGQNFYDDPDVALIDDPVEGKPDPKDAPNWQGNLPDTGDGAELWDPTQGSAADLPPTTMYIGTRDVLAPSELTFAERMIAAGSPVDLVIGLGQIHDWATGGISTSSQAPVYRRAIYRELGLIN